MSRVLIAPGRYRDALVASVRDYPWLVLLGSVSALVYAGYFLTSFPLLRYYAGPYMDMGQITGHSRIGLASYIAAFVLLFALFGLAWRLVQPVRGASPLPLILGFGALFAVIMIFVYPITALDVFAYIAYNLVSVVYHHNPIITPPAAISDPLMGLADGYGGQGAPYGPLGLSIMAAPTVLAGRNVLANLLLLKLMFSAGTLAIAYMVYRILERVEPRYAASGALLVAWNPFLLFENSANAHNDVLMAFFVVLALLSIVNDELTIGMVLLAASVLVKYTSVVLLPVCFVYALTRHDTWRERLRYTVLTGVSMVAFGVIIYLPYWSGASQVFAPLLAQNQRHLYSFTTFLNDIFPNLSLATGATLGRLLFVVAYLFTLRLAMRGTAPLLRACYLAVFLLFLLGSTNFLYWYAVLPVVLAAAVPLFAERLSAFIMALAVETVAVALNIFVWVWLGVTPESFRGIDAVTYATVFLVPAGVLIALNRDWWPVMVRRRISEAGREEGTSASQP